MCGLFPCSFHINFMHMLQHCLFHLQELRPEGLTTEPLPYNRWGEHVLFAVRIYLWAMLLSTLWNSSRGTEKESAFLDVWENKPPFTGGKMALWARRLWGCKRWLQMLAPLVLEALANSCCQSLQTALPRNFLYFMPESLPNLFTMSSCPRPPCVSPKQGGALWNHYTHYALRKRLYHRRITFGFGILVRPVLS